MKKQQTKLNIPRDLWIGIPLVYWDKLNYMQKTHGTNTLSIFFVEMREKNKLIFYFMDNVLDLNGGYHSSWSTLMPVVEKIKDIDNQADIEFAVLRDQANLEIFHTSIFCPLDAVYERVIEFIKWYNKIYEGQ